MKTIDEFDISELMRIINFQMSENQQLKNGLAELKVKYKQLFEENRVLKVEKNRLLQKNAYLIKLSSDNQQLRIEKNELRNKIKSLKIKGIL